MEVTVVQYVSQLADEGMTLAAIRRVLELEDQVRTLQAERDALVRALAERDRLLASLHGAAADLHQVEQRRRRDPYEGQPPP